MKYLPHVLAITLFTGLLSSQAETRLPPIKDEGKDVSGVYLLNGIDGGSEYSGSVVITRVKNAYIFQYSTVTETEKGMSFSAMQGIGVLKGNSISVGWGVGEKVTGATHYTIEGKNLSGTWTMLPGDGNLKEEQLTFLTRGGKTN